MQDRFKYKVKFETEGQVEIFDVIDISFESQQVFFKRQDGVVYNIGLGVKGAELMQCTGSKDKYGKLIYEGDIIKCSYGSEFAIGVIEWDSEELKFALKIENTFYSIRQITKFDIIEILGNIYENPKLLKDNE